MYALKILWKGGEVKLQSEIQETWTVKELREAVRTALRIGKRKEIMLKTGYPPRVVADEETRSIGECVERNGIVRVEVEGKKGKEKVEEKKRESPVRTPKTKGRKKEEGRKTGIYTLNAGEEGGNQIKTTHRQK